MSFLVGYVLRLMEIPVVVADGIAILRMTKSFIVQSVNYRTVGPAFTVVNITERQRSVVSPALCAIGNDPVRILPVSAVFTPVILLGVDYSDFVNGSGTYKLIAPSVVTFSDSANDGKVYVYVYEKM
jgi:hypothetical protein